MKKKYGTLAAFAVSAILIVMVIILPILCKLTPVFCKYLCPLGAVYAPCNKISLVQLKLDASKCIGCKACRSACDMCVDPSVIPDSTECIRCGKCISVCPKDAVKNEDYALTFSSLNILTDTRNHP